MEGFDYVKKKKKFNFFHNHMHDKILKEQCYAMLSHFSRVRLCATP